MDAGDLDDVASKQGKTEEKKMDEENPVGIADSLAGYVDDP